MRSGPQVQSAGLPGAMCPLPVTEPPAHPENIQGGFLTPSQPPNASSWSLLRKFYLPHLRENNIGAEIYGRICLLLGILGYILTFSGSVGAACGPAVMLGLSDLSSSCLASGPSSTLSNVFSPGPGVFPAPPVSGLPDTLRMKTQEHEGLGCFPHPRPPLPIPGRFAVCLLTMVSCLLFLLKAKLRIFKRW